MDDIEAIMVGESALAYVIRVSVKPSATEFFTPAESAFQAGFVVYPTGGAVAPHLHLPVTRTIVGTCELLLVRSGRCEVDIYTDDRTLVATRELNTGDAVLCLAGGHGFRMTEDTVLLELKQGPFGGASEKERFDPESGSTGA